MKQGQEMSKEEELDSLKKQAQALAERIAEINRRIEEMERS